MPIPHNPDEIIAVVDNNDIMIDKLPRKIVHDRWLLHRETALLIVNFQNEILIQKRADNKKFSVSVEGHFPFDSNYSDAIVREAKEELGLYISKNELKEICKLKIRSVNNNYRFVKFFEIKKDVDLSSLDYDKWEVDSVYFFSKEELVEIMEKSPEKVTKGLRVILKEYL